MLYIKYYQIFPSNMYAKYYPDMIFVKKFTPPDFQAKQFTPLISPYFNSFGDKNTKNEWDGEIFTAGKHFTLPSAMAAVTNLTSASRGPIGPDKFHNVSVYWLIVT